MDSAGISPPLSTARVFGAPSWLTPLTKRNLVVALEGGASVRVDVLGERLFRVRHAKTGQWTESALNRYGIPDIRLLFEGDMRFLAQMGRAR